MKTSLLIIIVGAIIASSVIFVMVWNHNNANQECSEDCEIERRRIGDSPTTGIDSGTSTKYVELSGIIHHWQPEDGPAYSLITSEPINAQVNDVGIFLYGDVLRPHMKNEFAIVKGLLISNYVEYKRSLGLKIFGGDPYTATILVDEIQIKSFGNSTIVEIQQLSKNKILSKGTGFDLPEDTFTQEDLKQLQQKETDLRKIAASPETLDEQRRQIHLEINEMQDRLQYPFQNGMPYLLVKAIKEKFVILENNFDDIRKDVHFSRLSSNQISSEHHALRIGLHPDSFTLSEIEYQDEKIREYLGDEMNILYESVLIMPD